MWGDVGWGLAGLLLFGIVLIPMIGAAAVLGIAPPNIDSGAPPPPDLKSIPFAVLLHLFFGFTIAAFQEETLFRGFLLNIFSERYGGRIRNILQAALFSLAHIGLETWVSLTRTFFILVLLFAAGLVFGWLKLKRGTLLAPAITHGILG